MVRWFAPLLIVAALGGFALGVAAYIAQPTREVQGTCLATVYDRPAGRIVIECGVDGRGILEEESE